MKSLNGPIHILGISGSLRAASMHGGLLRAFGELLPEETTFKIADLHHIPLYNAEIDQPKPPEGVGQPESVTRLKAQILAADLLVFASPEYNGSISGVLKNAIDWATRPISESSLAGKLAVAMTSAGRSGGIKNLAHLRQILGNCNVNLMLRPEFSLALARQKFDPHTGDLIDEEVRHELAHFIEKSLEWTYRQNAWKLLEAVEE